MVSFTSLPVELVIQVLSYLDVADLYSIGDTCQSLNHLINNEELWKNMFTRAFGTSRFSSCSQSSKFSVELAKRNKIIHSWRKGTGIHKTQSINSTYIEELIFNYPKVLAFNNQGNVSILSLEKNNIEATIPVTTPDGCTAYSFSASASVFGRWDGKIFGKLLASKTYLAQITEFNKQHAGMVTAIYNDGKHCYSGDETGKLYVFELKDGHFIKEYNVSTKPLLKVYYNSDTIIAIDSDQIYIIEREQVQTIYHKSGTNFFEVDFGGKNIIMGSSRSLHLYSFDPSKMGYTSQIDFDEDIHCISLESKGRRNSSLAGSDGCNLGIVTHSGMVFAYNVRALKTNSEGNLVPQVSIVPIFDNLKVPSGLPPINSIAVNSSVILLGSYNGYAAVYDILRGDKLKVVSSRVPKKYLPLNTAPYLVPVNLVKLGAKEEANGLLAVGGVVQYFQFGELQNTYITSSRQKKKKQLRASSDRKDIMKKHIQNDLDELDYLEHEDIKKEKLLAAYNGDEYADDAEQLELAMVLNASVQEESMNQRRAKEEVGLLEEAEIDEDLARALELSKLQHSAQLQAEDFYGEIEGVGSSSSQTHQEPLDDYEQQLQEALRRSLYQ